MQITQADGLAIGMATWGRPWIFQSVKDYLARGEYQEFAWPEVRKVIFDHAQLAFKQKGQYGLIELRKHLCWYVRGQKNASELRQKLVRVETVADIKRIIKN